MAVVSSLLTPYRATSARLGAVLFLLRGTCDAWSFAPPLLYDRPPSNNNRLTTMTLSASISSVVDLDESTPRNVESMEEWATNYGVQYADGFALAPTAEADPDCDTVDRHDMSVVTNADLAAESPVLYVPADLILTSTAARQQLSSNGLSDALDLLARLQSSSDDDDAEFCLFGKVLVEYEQGDASPWFAWLNSLPRTFYNGASMTPFCYECLPPLVATLAMKERVKFINFFEALKKVDFVTDDTKYDRDLARWAFQIVTTRAFPDETTGEYRIVPMADMFNHATEPEVFLSYDDEGNCYAYTTMDVPAGSPLRVSYGDPTNPSFFFAKYGFLDETSPATFCKIMLKPTTQLRNMGYDYSRMLFFKDSGEASTEVWDILLYQNLATDPSVQKAFYDAHMAGDEATKQSIHEHYYEETLASLRKHVNDFLQQLEQLSQKAVGKDYREHPRLPLILKHNEFVKETFLAVKAQLDTY